MSGGSFNYLYDQQTYNASDLEAMAADLEQRGMYEAAEETLALLPRRAPRELALLWKAVEWHRSNDWSEAQVAREYVHYEKTRIAALNPPG